MKFKRLTAMLIAVAMTVGMMPALVFAEETTDSEPSETTVAQTTESKEPKETKEKKPAETTVGDQRDKQQPNESTSDSKQGKPVESEPSSDPEPEATKETTTPETSGENDKRDDSEKTTESEPVPSTKPAEEEPTAPETKEDEDKGSDSDETTESEPDPTTEPAPESSKRPDESAYTPGRNGTGTEITSVSVEIDAPVIGEHPDYEAEIPPDENRYSVDSTTGGDLRNGISWFDCTTNHFLDPDSVFQNGHQYEVYIRIKCADGYYYSENTLVTLNGNTVTKFVYLLNYIYYEFPKLGEIRSVSLSVTAPVIGASPILDVDVPSGVDYSVDEVYLPYWYDLTTNAHIYPNDGVFQVEHQYMIEIYLKAKDGCVFLGGATGTVNDHTANCDIDAGYLRVRYTFPKLEYNTAISVNLDDPVIGAHPDYVAEFPQDATCYSDTYNGGPTRNGIYWYDVTTNTYLDPDNGVFQAGHQYKVQVDLKAKEGIFFNDSTIATLNGNATEKRWATSDYFSFYYTFPVVESNVGDTEKAGNYNYTITKSASGGTGCVTLTGVDTEETAVSIPDTVEINGYNYAVTRIGPKAFYGNKTIKTLFIGTKVTIIDSSAFNGCSNLFKVSGGKAVQTIGSYAFANCPKLSSFTITSYALKKIGSYAFNKDKKLKTLYIRNTSRLTKSGIKKSLKGSSVKTVKVKKSKVKKYKKYFKKSNSGRTVKVKK